VRICTTVLVLVASLGVSLGGQATRLSEGPLPVTGIDFSAVDQIWKVVDVLSTDTEPSEEQWRSLLATPGYRLAQSAVGEGMRENLEIAFRPSLRAARDSLLRLDSDRAFDLKHLIRAVRLRNQLVTYRDSLHASALIRNAVDSAARFLPPGATAVGQPPLVAFALFKDDGYSVGSGVVVDLLHAYESNLVLFLGHEFNHAYLARANTRPSHPVANAAENQLLLALTGLRNEGIADQIDKPYPLVLPNPALSVYVARYNAEYARTPATLHSLDSLLAAVSDDPTLMTAAGQRARTLLWSNGHPNGAYIAREIYETFGVDSLFPAVTDPAAFLRTYAAAEASHGRPAPFSPRALRTIGLLETRYWHRPTSSVGNGRSP
jgi:hypothetical protein